MKFPKLITGGFSADDRGFVNFNNNFVFNKIKRFYIVENHRSGFIRAWHAHKREEKFVLCLSGSAMVSAVKINNFKAPDKKAKIFSFILTSRSSSILYIPKAYANGFKTLTKDAKLMFFSSSTLKQSIKDDFRYKFDYWNPWIENFR